MKLCVLIMAIFMMVQARFIYAMNKDQVKQISIPTGISYHKYKFIKKWLEQIPQVQQCETIKDESQTPSLPAISQTTNPDPIKNTSEKNLGQFTCPVRYCKKRYSSMPALKIHAHQHHNVFLCPCMAYFKSLNLFTTHYTYCREKVKFVSL